MSGQRENHLNNQLQNYGTLKSSRRFNDIWLLCQDAFKVSKISYSVVQVLSYCSWALQEVRFSLSLHRREDGENPASSMGVSPGLLLTAWNCYGSWRQKRTNSLMHLQRGRDAQDIAVVGSTPPQQNVGCLLDGVSHRIQPRSKNGS
jgi:hypothetical protein